MNYGLLTLHYHYSFLLTSIYLDDERMGHSNMANVLGLLNGRQGIKFLLAVDAVAAKRIDSQVADAQARQILEEVGALARIYLEGVEPGLYDDLRGADIRPLDWDDQPRVTNAPASWAYE